MLDNERLIYKMLLEQKIKLVTGVKFYESSPVGAYEFPVIRFGGKSFRGSGEAVLTQFPSEGTLASSWNTDLTQKVFSAAGEEAKLYSAYDGYFSCNDPKGGAVSSSHFLSAQYHSAKNRGAAEKQPTAHRVNVASFGEEQLRKNFTETMLEEGAPDVLIAECVEDAEFYLKHKDFTGLVFGVANNPEEAARYFFAGCAFVYLQDGFLREFTEFIDVRVKNYRVAFGEYREGKLSLKELDRRARALDIFDEGLIDNACDRIINYLKKKKKAAVRLQEGKTAAEEVKALSETGRHARLARRAARESAVLMKNENKTLPLKRGTKVALIGEYLENYDFQREAFSCSPTNKRLPIDVARDYEELNFTGYAVGYRKGEGVDEELVSNAARLSSSADYALVFLSAEAGSDTLPENQILLIKALAGWNTQIIAVVAADRCLDTSYFKYCRAVLFMGRGGQEAASAAFDLVTGAFSPSGRLTESVAGEGGFPFGYGLTYSAFEYRDLEIDESGVTLIVENKGNYDAAAVVQLYLQKDGSMYSDKTLKGFSKEFIKKGDAVRVKIPFTQNTFRYYDEAKKKYRTEGGKYNLYISENATVDKLAGTVKIAADDGDVFSNTVSETYTDEKKAAFSETRGIKEKKGMSFGMKLFLALALFVYFNAVMAMLLFADFVPVDRTELFYGVVGAVTGVADILIIAYIVVIGVKRQKSFIPVNDVLSDMVERVDEFVQIAKLTYPDPVKEKAKAEKAKKEAELKAEQAKKEEAEKERAEREKEKQEEEERAKAEKTKEEKAEASKKPAAPSLDKPDDYPQADSFESMYASFRKYFMERGINIGAASARRLLAAIASSRLVLVSSANTELLPEFLQTLNAYFSGLGVSVAEDSWNTLEDLLWREVAGKSTTSGFANSLNDASRRHNKNAVAIIANVDSCNLSDWYADMIEFASAPSEEHVIVFNDENKITVPKNLCSLLFAKENGFETELQREVLQAALQIEISIRRAENVAENPETAGAVSYPNFCALVRESREKYFMSEKVWNKIDALFEFVNDSSRFAFGNKSTLMAEKFTSVLMACGAEESEAITSLLRFKIVPLLKTTRLYAQEDGITLLTDFIQKTFPDEDLAKVKKLLSERPKKAEGKVRNVFFTPGQTEEEIVQESAPAEEAQAEAPVSAPAAETAQSDKTDDTADEAIFVDPVAEQAESETGTENTAEAQSEAGGEVQADAEIPPAPAAEEAAFEPAFESATPNYESGQSAFTGEPAYESSPAYGNVGADGYGYNGYAQENYAENNYAENNYAQEGYGAYQGGYAGYSDGGYGEYGSYSAGEYPNENGGGQNK